jgi:predicted ATP-grasp superfamily ATP-dependent carboligase
MGYLGVDIVLDPRRGPLVLEVNARPGLAIQLANRTGLKPLLAAVDRELAPREGVETTTALQGVPREEALSGPPLR